MGSTVELCNPVEVYGDPSQLYEQHIPRCPQFTVYDHYVNSCVPASLIQFQDQENERAMYIIYAYLLPVLSLIVLISHGIVLFVLNEQKSKRASVEPLMCMAISALLMAVAPLPFTLYYYNLGHLMDYNQTEFLCYLQKISMEILPFFFNTLITFFTLLLGLQRFIAIQHPLDSFRWCTRRKMRLYSKIVVVTSLFLSAIHSMFDVRTIYHFCISNRQQSFWVARCFVGYSSITRAIGANVLAEVFDLFRISITLIPSVFLFIITILLIRTVRATDRSFVISEDNKNISTINRHKKITKASRNTTVMLTVIIVLFLVGRMPSTILILLVNISGFLPIQIEFLHDAYLRAFTNIIMMTVHPISFAVYMLMSRRFRISLRRLLGLKFLATDEEMRTMSTKIFSFVPQPKPKDSTVPLIELKKTDFEFNNTAIRSRSCSSHRKVAFAPDRVFLENERRLSRSISNPLGPITPSRC